MFEGGFLARAAVWFRWWKTTLLFLRFQSNGYTVNISNVAVSAPGFLLIGFLAPGSFRP
jgi:hypothetical protein